MMTITREQRQAVEQTGDQPVRLEDPENHRAYVLLKEEAYERLVSTNGAEQVPLPEIPEGIRRSQDAFFRDLPELLKDETLRGKRIAYHGDERIGIAPRAEPLIRECSRRGLSDDQYDVFIIEPQSREPQQVEIVTPCV
jgi:hypothetical protein